jgi:hypothetical protein
MTTATTAAHIPPDKNHLLEDESGNNNNLDDPLAMKSPGSLMGSSIRSDQVSSFDTADNSHTSWRIGMPWFRTRSNDRHTNLTATNNKSKLCVEPPIAPAMDVHEDRYYGGIMKSAETVDVSHNNQTNKSNRGGVEGTKTSAATTANTTTNFPRTLSSRSQDSLADFHDSEWTPQDSSYGAACPVCGCVPKHVRRLVEFSMISAIILGFVYFLVMTSINVSSSSSLSSSSSALDTSSDGYYHHQYYDSGSNNNNSSNYSNNGKTYSNNNDDDADEDSSAANNNNAYTYGNDDDDTDVYNNNGGNGGAYNNNNKNNNQYYYNANNGGGGRGRYRERIRRRFLRYGLGNTNSAQ